MQTTNIEDYAHEWPMRVDGFGRLVVETPREMRGKELDFIINYVARVRRVDEVSDNYGAYFRALSDENGDFVDWPGLFADELRAMCEEHGIHAGEAVDRKTLRLLSRLVRVYLIGFGTKRYEVSFVPAGEAWLSWFEEHWERFRGRGDVY